MSSTKDKTLPWSRDKKIRQPETPLYQILSVTNYGGEILFKGIPFAYLDRTGHFGIWNTAKYVMHSAFLMFQRGYFDRNVLDSDLTRVFLVNQSLRLSPNVYHDIIKVQMSDILVTTTAAAVGRSSMTNLYILSCAETKKELARCTTTTVLIDIKTRLPIPLPGWFLKKYASNREQNEKLDILKKSLKTSRDFQQVPLNSFKMSVKIRNTDIDFNGHVNQTEYLNFCLECATDATIAGYYRHFALDILRYPILESDIIYLGESRVGEILEVSSWQDKINDQIINFSILNKAVSKCAAVASIKLEREALRSPKTSYL